MAHTPLRAARPHPRRGGRSAERTNACATVPPTPAAQHAPTLAAPRADPGRSTPTPASGHANTVLGHADARCAPSTTLVYVTVVVASGLIGGLLAALVPAQHAPKAPLAAAIARPGPRRRTHQPAAG